MDLYALREALVGSPRAGETDKDAHRRTSRALTQSGMDFGLNPQAASGAADLLGLLNEAVVSEGMTKFGPAGFDHADIEANRAGQRDAMLERDDSVLRSLLRTLPPQQLANILGELVGDAPPEPREQDVQLRLPPRPSPARPDGDLPPPPEVQGFLRSLR